MIQALTFPTFPVEKPRHGYTFEELRFIVGPMANDGVQPLGSMGTDTSLAVISNK